MDVFVTDGDQRSSLAAVRALGREGIRVTVGSAERASLAGASRFCASHVQYPSPRKDPKGFQSFLRAETARSGTVLLLPMTDVTVQLVVRMRNLLPARVQVPFPGEDAIDWVQDKRRVLLAARDLGMGIPETCLLEPEERLEDVAKRVRYPAVIKPRFSRYLCGNTWVNGDVLYARDADELRTMYMASHAKIPFPLVQEKIEGEGRGVFLLLWNGELKGAFCHRRLREKPPWGGPSVYRESIPLDETLVERSTALLQTIGWQGAAMVEFKMDGTSGEAKLMEVNGRFWGSLQLASDAGMNFPLLLYRLVCGDNPAAQFDYRTGVRSRWLLGDLDHLLIRLRGERGPDGSGDGIRGSRLGACADFLRFYERNTRYEVFRWEDVRPGMREILDYARALGSRAVRKKEKRDAN